MRAALLFLRLNGWFIKEDIDQEEINEKIKDLAVCISEGRIEIKEISEFFKKYSVKP